MSECKCTEACGEPKATFEEAAFYHMKEAFRQLTFAPPTRENSLAKTKLEEAMMWCNKDRYNKGCLPPDTPYSPAE